MRKHFKKRTENTNNRHINEDPKCCSKFDSHRRGGNWQTTCPGWVHVEWGPITGHRPHLVLPLSWCITSNCHCVGPSSRMARRPLANSGAETLLNTAQEERCLDAWAERQWWVRRWESSVYNFVTWYLAAMINLQRLNTLSN